MIACRYNSGTPRPGCGCCTTHYQLLTSVGTFLLVDYYALVDYSSEFSRLNSVQRRAVEAIEGPVMVIAGPGTGKTQVLAIRVGRILEKTQVNPSNILCLTFSLAGAKAMRERLRALIGPSAYGVTVSTIHGFCNDLILQYPQIFEDFPSSEQVSDLSALRIVRKAIADLGSGSQLGRISGAEKDRASDVLSAIHELKREGVSPEHIESILV